MLSLPYAALFFNLILHIKPIRLLILWFIFCCRITVQPPNLVGMFYAPELFRVPVTVSKTHFWFLFCFGSSILADLLNYFQTYIQRSMYSDTRIQVQTMSFENTSCAISINIFVPSDNEFHSRNEGRFHSLLEFVFNIL